MNYLKLTFLFIAFTLLISCKNKKEEEPLMLQGMAMGNGNGIADSREGAYMEESSENQKMKAPAVDYDISKENIPQRQVLTSEKNSKKIIKDGKLTLKSKNIASSKQKMDSLLNQFNAYYETEDLQNNDQTTSYNLKIRIPSISFENFILNLENGKEELISKSIQARDITEEFTDLSTRLVNKKEYLNRYRQLLTRAAGVKDILAIEENIRNLEEEIESTEGRLKYLNDQVSYSTLLVEIFQEKEYIYKPQEQDKFTERVKTSLSNGWKSVVDFVLLLISKWPYGILLCIAYFFYKRFKNKTV